MKVSNPSFIYSLDETLGHDDREEAIVDEIRSFERLPAGWHYGEGHGATGLAVESALAMQALLMTNKADEVEVFPDVSGGVLLSGYCQDETMEIFCDHDGRINIIHEVGGEIAYEKDDVSAQEVNEYMRELFREVIRLLHPKHFSKARGRFTSLAFKNSSKDGGVSVIDSRCAREHSGSECKHIS